MTKKRRKKSIGFLPPSQQEEKLRQFRRRNKQKCRDKQGKKKRWNRDPNEIMHLSADIDQSSEMQQLSNLSN